MDNFYLQYKLFMDKIKTFGHVGMLLVIALAFMVKTVKGQSTDSSAICTGAMIRSFSPCLGYLAFRSNESSPSSACCNSLRSLMSNGQDCLCLMITGGSSLQIPLNQTLAMSLPRACRTSGVPIECKEVSSPAPAPGQGNRGQGGTNTSPGRVSPPPGDTAVPGPNPSPGSQGQGGSYAPPPELVTPPYGGSNNPQTPSGGFTTPPSPTTQGGGRGGGGGGGGGGGNGGALPNLTPPGMRPTLTQSAAHEKSHLALSISILVAMFGVIYFLNLY